MYALQRYKKYVTHCLLLIVVFAFLTPKDVKFMLTQNDL